MPPSAPSCTSPASLHWQELPLGQEKALLTRGQFHVSPLLMVGTCVSVYPHRDTCTQLCAQSALRPLSSGVETVAKSVCWFDLNGVCLQHSI